MVAHADRLPGLALGPGQGRKQQAGQDGDDGDDHQQFDKREGVSTVCFHSGWGWRRQIGLHRNLLVTAFREKFCHENNRMLSIIRNFVGFSD